MNGRRYKKRMPKRRALRRKRAYRKRRSTYRDLNSKQFVRKAFLATINPNALNVNYGATDFRLNQLPNIADFTNLFGQYRINKIKLTMTLNQDQSAQTSTNAVFPRLYVQNNYLDATPPSDANELRQSPNTKQISMRSGKMYTFWIKPAVASYLYVSATSSGYTPRWNTWIRSSDSTLPHYGFKWAVENLIQNVYSIAFEATFYISCRDVQ